MSQQFSYKNVALRVHKTFLIIMFDITVSAKKKLGLLREREKLDSTL
jgi:hypothetical protein